MVDFLDGNDLVVRGAVDAGCRFFAGYPITPVSSLMNGMVEALPRVEGIAMEAEDEIAAIGFCIGASLAGMKAMTATSGPGLSLFSENIGLAVMVEAPLVIVVSQRQGPATGSATRTAQGDIQFIRWGTSGGMPVVALCPTTPAECYTLTLEAFHWAEALRAPVFLVMDRELSLTRERVDLAALNRPTIREVGRRALPFSPIGRETITRCTTSTHNEEGLLTTDPAAIQRLIDHFVAKIEDRREELTRIVFDRQEGAETLVVSYGITARSAREAVAAARKEGNRVSHLLVYSLWPVPETAIREAARGVRRVVVPEMNMGQYRLEIERIVGREAEVAGVNKMDTTLISPVEIMEALK
ncbi:MAG: pyruvate flavodoxin/ferredoxin oxidoreductase [Nitrospirae bacterium]|nr:pyruvate flavodoxin/ferredoxin oxidoreductase [Nitrospirota bacterium]